MIFSISFYIPPTSEASIFLCRCGWFGRVSISARYVVLIIAWNGIVRYRLFCRKCTYRFLSGDAEPYTLLFYRQYANSTVSLNLENQVSDIGMLFIFCMVGTQTAVWSVILCLKLFGISATQLRLSVPSSQASPTIVVGSMSLIIVWPESSVARWRA